MGNASLGNIYRAQGVSVDSRMSLSGKGGDHDLHLRDSEEHIPQREALASLLESQKLQKHPSDKKR